MKILYVFLFWVILSVNLQAQTVISGVVTDASHNPIPYATVYLAKTTYGVITDDQGAYSLTIPKEGTYRMICSCVGYESFSRILVADTQDKKLDIMLSERNIMISEVTVKDKDVNRKQNYEHFLMRFMGKTLNAPLCKIDNPKDLVVYRDSKDSNLIAYSVKPLIITNSGLGYKIIYDLKYFRFNLHTKHLRFLGDYYFKDISSRKRTNSRINRSRLIAYYGSRMHFLRALYSDSLNQENFLLCNIEPDSCGTKTITHSLKGADLRLKADSGSMTLYHETPVIIYYADNHPELYPLPNVYRYREYASRIDFSNTVKVYKDGYYPDAYNISWSGAMGEERVAEMLPYDYVPRPLKKLLPEQMK